MKRIGKRFGQHAISLCLMVVLSVTSIADVQAQRGRKKRNAPDTQTQEQSQQKAEEQFIEGQKYFILEDYAKAFVYFQRALDLEPKNAAIHYKIAQVLAKGEEVDKALLSINDAIELDPNNEYYYLLAADLYTRQSNFDQATTMYEELIGRVKGTDQYLFDLAAIYLFKSDLEQALATYNRAENAFGVSEQISFQKQKIYLKQNKLDEAIKEGQKLIDAFPAIENYRMALAEILISNKRENEGIKLLEELLEENPANSQARLTLSDAYKTAGEEEKAQEQVALAFDDPQLDLQFKVEIVNSFLGRLSDPGMRRWGLILSEKIVQLHPNQAVAHTTRANIFLELAEKEKAVEEYLYSITLDDSNFAVWQNILNLESDLDLIDSVLVHSEAALELFPNQNVFYYYNGYANYRKDNFPEAIQALEQGRKLSRSDAKLTSLFNSMLGDAYNGAKLYDKSDAAYEAVLNHNPNDDLVLNNYSYFLSLRRDKLETAKRMSAKLVERNPDNATYLDTHAWVLFMLGEYEEARKYIEKALASEEDNATHFEHYGDILYKLGDIDGAVEQWQKSKELNPSSDLIDKKIADRKLHE